MTTQKPTKQIIRYWHPRLGGWYHATMIRNGYKWAVIAELVTGKRRRVPISDVKEVA